MRFVHLVMLVMCGAGCSDGQLDVGVDENTQTDFSEIPRSSTPDAGTTTPAFSLPREYAQLLPFHVRINKLSSIAGLPSNDPSFDAVWRNRYALGDHNFGQGIGADLTWSAAKMSTWVKSVKPICASEAMKSRFPALPEDLNEFAIAAYGREVTQEDLELVETAVELSPVPEQRYEAVCLAILSSMEFVGR